MEQKLCGVCSCVRLPNICLGLDTVYVYGIWLWMFMINVAYDHNQGCFWKHRWSNNFHFTLEPCSPPTSPAPGPPLQCLGISTSLSRLQLWPSAEFMLEPVAVNSEIGSRSVRASSDVMWLWLWPGTEDYRSKLGGDCFADLACPEKCRCEGTTVDCSNQKLTKIPDHIPQYTAELWVTVDLSGTKKIHALTFINSSSFAFSPIVLSLCDFDHVSSFSSLSSDV